MVSIVHVFILKNALFTWFFHYTANHFKSETKFTEDKTFFYPVWFIKNFFLFTNQEVSPSDFEVASYSLSVFLLQNSFRVGDKFHQEVWGNPLRQTSAQSLVKSIASGKTSMSRSVSSKWLQALSFILLNKIQEKAPHWDTACRDAVCTWKRLLYKNCIISHEKSHFFFLFPSGKCKKYQQKYLEGWLLTTK